MRAMDMMPYDQLNLLAILWLLILPVALFEFRDPVDDGPATPKTVLSALRGRGHAGGPVCCLPAVMNTNCKSSRRS